MYSICALDPCHRFGPGNRNKKESAETQESTKIELAKKEKERHNENVTLTLLPTVRLPEPLQGVPAAGRHGARSVEGARLLPWAADGDGEEVSAELAG